MATDATGAPTSLGIPKIDPDADAPSGLGTNAAMDSIDTLLLARPSKPVGIVSGEAMVWNGASWDRSSVTRVGATSLGSGTPDATKFLRGDGAWSVATQGPNKITTSTMAGGPPGSPTDGDIWVATAVDANGTRWSFQYNAGSASAYKWEFIGGTPVSVQTASATVASAAYADMTSAPTITLARAGEYHLGVSGAYWTSTVATSIGAAAVGNAGVLVTNTLMSLTFALSATSYTFGHNDEVAVVTAGYVAKMQGNVNGGATMTIVIPKLTALPRRIS